MKLSQIEIERYRGLRNLSFNLADKNLQVIAGPNNAGKTTLISALDFFFSLQTDQEDPFKFAPRNKYYQDEGRRALTRIRLHFRNLNSEEKQIFESAYLPRKHGLWVEARITRQGIVSFLASNGVDGKEIHAKLLDCFRIIHVPVLRIGDAGFASTETKRLYSTIHEILVRKRPGRDSSEQSNLKKNYEKLQKIINEVFNEGKKRAKNVLPLDANINFSTPEVSKFVNLLLSQSIISTNVAKSLQLTDEGSGFQSLLALGLLDYAISGKRQGRSNILLLLEEPEAFLHPQYQRTIANYVNKLSDKAQVIVTTHSPVIIDSVPILSVARLKRDSAGLEYVWKAKLLSDAEAGKLERFCDARNSELVFANKVIFCEGPTDAKVIQLLLSQYISSVSTSENISVIDMNGKNSIHHFAELARRFGLEYLIVTDKDFYSGNRDALKNLIKSTSYSVPGNFWADLDNLCAASCNTWAKARNIRDSANKIFQDLYCFTVGSDIEGAVVTSVKKNDLLLKIGPKVLHIHDQIIIDELSALSGNKFHYRLLKLFGSKGWEKSGKKDKNNCPKPHVLADLLEKTPGSIIRNSDISELKKVIVNFSKK